MEQVAVVGAIAITAGLGTQDVLNKTVFAADATGAYRPGGRFSPGTKKATDDAATNATGQEGTCEYCGILTVPEAGSPTSKEYDHQKSRKKGGDNSPDNGRRSRRTCNRKFGPNDKPDPRVPPPETGP